MVGNTVRIDLQSWQKAMSHDRLLFFRLPVPLLDGRGRFTPNQLDGELVIEDADKVTWQNDLTR